MTEQYYGYPTQGQQMTMKMKSKKLSLAVVEKTLSLSFLSAAVIGGVEKPSLSFVA